MSRSGFLTLPGVWGSGKFCQSLRDFSPSFPVAQGGTSAPIMLQDALLGAACDVYLPKIWV